MTDFDIFVSLAVTAQFACPEPSTPLNFGHFAEDTDLIHAFAQPSTRPVQRTLSDSGPQRASTVPRTCMTRVGRREKTCKSPTRIPQYTRSKRRVMAESASTIHPLRSPVSLEDRAQEHHVGLCFCLDCSRGRVSLVIRTPGASRKVGMWFVGDPLQ
jgi:hypothetical protein